MGNIVDTNGGGGGTSARVTNSSVWTGLYDASGNPITKPVGTAGASTDSGLPASVLHNNHYLGVRGDQYGSLTTKAHQILIDDYFENATISPQRWLTSALNTTLTALAGVGLNIIYSSLAANSYYTLTSKSLISKKLRTPIFLRANVSSQVTLNTVFEVGFLAGTATPTNSAITNGAYWTQDGSGNVYPVIVGNGNTVTGATVAGLTSSNFYMFDIIYDDDQFIFTLMDKVTGNIISRQILRFGDAQAKNFAYGQVRAYTRLYSGATIPTTCRVLLADFIVSQLDENNNYTAAESSAKHSLASEYIPATGAVNENWTNSTLPTPIAAISNTANAGYATIGGRFGLVTPAGAVTDGILFAYQVPSNFHVKGVCVETYIYGAATVTTDTTLLWSIANSTGISLATSTNVERRQIGLQYFPVSAAVGTQAEPIYRQFTTPMVIPVNNYLIIILTIPISTTNASQSLYGNVEIEGFYD